MKLTLPPKGGNIYTWLFLGWMGLSFVTVWAAGIGCYSAYTSGTSSYAELLIDHAVPITPISLVLLTTAISFVVAIVILRSARKWWLGLFFLLFIPFASAMLLFSSFSMCQQTTLQHVDTIEFGSHTYHLTLGDRTGFLVDFWRPLYLFRCDSSDRYCQVSVLNPFCGSCAYREDAPRFVYSPEEDRVHVMIDDRLWRVIHPSNE